MAADPEKLIEEPQSLVEVSSEGGIIARHPRLAPPPARVAPTLAKEFNAIGLRIAPLACWRAHDMRFAFASSFPRPELQTELRGLKRLIDVHTIPDPANGKPHRPPLSIFGHADPTGDDEFNKQLSGRRALSVYGLLTRDEELLEELFSKPLANDIWGDPALQLMVSTVNTDPSPSAQEASVKSAKKSASARKQLFRQYADALCVGRDGKPFTVAKDEFLGRGVDKNAKGDVQGCGEFNPVMVFSKPEQIEFDSPNETPVRDQENAANRRVVIFLFRPGVKVDPAAWPCPRATEPTGACRKRFWSDGEKRRANSDTRRAYEETNDTFACRFYDRLSNKSPCERFLPQLMPFRYGLEVNPAMPWPLDATLRFVSEDNSIVKAFAIGAGKQVADLRVFEFDDYPRGVKFRGEVLQGDFTIPLFDHIDLFRIQDPADAENVLPLPPRQSAETPAAGPTVPIDLNPDREA